MRFHLVRKLIPGTLLMQGGHMGTHGHEGVPIPEVEAGRGFPGVDLWLGGGGGWFNFGVGFWLVHVLSGACAGGFSG